MKVLKNIDINPFSNKQLIIALGNFDGIHLGHQRLLMEMCQYARKLQAIPAVFLCHPHPLKVLDPSRAPKLLIDNEKKIELLKEIGIKAVFMVPFNLETASISPQKFVTDVLLKKLKVSGIFVGFNYRFGKGAKGTPELLRDYGEKHNFFVKVIPPVIVGKLPVSSTLVRAALTKGDILEAKKLLGYWPVIRGRVVRGDGRGKTLGFPTANIKLPKDILIPRTGVYAGLTSIKGNFYPAVLNIGKHPTFGCSKEKLIEAHLLGFNGNLYGKRMEISLLQWLRDERKFSTAQDLAEQIRHDIVETTALSEKNQATDGFIANANGHR